MEGQVPECGIKSKSSEDSRLGRFCHVPTIVSKSSARVKTLREQLFQVHGPKLFNCLPKSIIDTTGSDIDTFKQKLDSYISEIPDQPVIGDQIPTTTKKHTLKPSNSLVDQIREYQRKRRPGA